MSIFTSVIDVLEKLVIAARKNAGANTRIGPMLF